MRSTFIKHAVITLFIILLAACGDTGGTADQHADNGSVGDGDDSGNTDPPAAPADLSMTPQPIKTFSFNWTDVGGETEYRLFENPDGISGYTQIATIAADSESYDQVVSLPMRINARYILQACNAGGCSDSNEVSVSGTLVDAIGYVKGYFKATKSYADDMFGYSLALSDDGDTLAVGGGQWGAGVVYMFSRSGTNWSWQAAIERSSPDVNESGDGFGLSLSLSGDGNTLAVGAYLEGSAATGVNGDGENDSASVSGAAYVYSRDSNDDWTRQAYIKASNTGAHDQFGLNLALSGDGNTLAVGAHQEESSATGIGGNDADNSASEAGAVYVFSRDSDAEWTQQAYVKASNTDAYDKFGHSLTLSSDGDTLAVGANKEESNATGIDGDETDNSASDAGAVYVFSRDSSAEWTQQAYIKASNTETEDEFGYNLALSGDGDTLAVGAPGEDSSATGIDGDEDKNDFFAAGAVYVFSRSGDGWGQQAYVKASNTDQVDHFGFRLALSGDGDILAVGVHTEASDATGIGGDQTDNSISYAGAVYMFSRDSIAEWSQKAYVKASNTESSDFFGYRLALSGDGETLAVGAYKEDSHGDGTIGVKVEKGSTNIDGDQTDNSAESAGAVYLY